ncbi:phosphatase PAP2 family protein [Sphingomonas sp. PB4P5]|uniref:phosphatase PAP2 family protein n=1 Tax=Parasphingomonas puruogangriensis TaxID=3096155 RepID=UPI002FC85371
MTATSLPPHHAIHAEGADARGVVPGNVRHLPWLLISGAALGLAILIVGAVGALIDRGWELSVDRAIMLWTRHGSAHGIPIGPPWVRSAMVDITALGGVTVLTVITVIVIGFLALKRLWLTMWLVLGGTISGAIAVAVAKSIVARPRPEIIDHLVTVSSASFPSGHATSSAIVYLTLAALIMQIVPGRLVRGYIICAAALLVGAIGCSRVYLGVHWPSDVLTGWGFGALWALMWWGIGAWARLRRAGRSLLHPGE